MGRTAPSIAATNPKLPTLTQPSTKITPSEKKKKNPLNPLPRNQSILEGSGRQYLYVIKIQ